MARKFVFAGLVFAGLVFLWVVLAWWLLVGGGWETAGSWFGARWEPGDFVRRICLAAGFSIYFLRLLFTVFVFQRQSIPWGGVIGIALWILCIYLVLAFFGGRNPRALGWDGGLGIVLFILGSWMNSYAEYARDAWKQRAENWGKLYTGSLFRYSQHPNYLGDLISFSGLCLIAGAWVPWILPLIMLSGFVFYNIPTLDAHLHAHYGAAFDDYAARTRKLIPFLY